jgi:hypothetical protein
VARAKLFIFLTLRGSGIKVEVTDIKTNTSTIYHAIRAAARALDIDKRYIEHYIYLKQAKPVLGRYIFKLVNFNSNKEITNLIKDDKFKLVN